tara:strand:- start:57 stop:629 length:573 start_codon:yes stop_codon:yes gene_type:complete
MNEPLKILNWDYVLGHDSKKIPQLTFKPSPEFISMSKINNNNLYVNIEGTGNKLLDRGNFRAVVDKSTSIVDADGMVSSCNIAQGCLNDYSTTTLLYTLTIPFAAYDEKISGGTFTLMEESVKAKKKKEPKKKPKKEPEKKEKEEPEKNPLENEVQPPDKSEPGLETLPLLFIGSIMITAAALTVFLIRR